MPVLILSYRCSKNVAIFLSVVSDAKSISFDGCEAQSHARYGARGDRATGGRLDCETNLARLPWED
jgi:hypothetical protein